MTQAFPRSSVAPALGSSSVVFAGDAGELNGSAAEVTEPAQVLEITDNSMSARASAYRNHKWVFIAAAGDLLMTVLAMLAAVWTRFSTLEGVGRFTELELETYVPHVLLGTLSLSLLMAWRGVYRREMLLQNRLQ